MVRGMYCFVREVAWIAVDWMFVSGEALLQQSPTDGS